MGVIKMDESGKIKAAIYIRVSTDKQEKYGYSLNEQLEVLSSWATELGYEVVEVYKDAISGKSSDRPSFERMINDAKDGKFNRILCISDDRFMRNAKELLKYIDLLEKYGVFVEFYTLRWLDIYKPEGRLLLTNKSSFSEYFLKELSLKVSYGIRQKKAKGEWFGKPPYGYKVIDVDGKTYLTYNDEEQKVINMIKEMLTKGYTVNEIVLELNRRGIKTRQGKLWNAANLRRLISNMRKSYDEYLYVGDGKI